MSQTIRGFMIGIEEVLVVLVVIGIAIAAVVFWIWMLIDCATKEPNEGNTKVVWVIVIAITGIIGAAIYYFVRRPQRIAEAGK